MLSAKLRSTCRALHNVCLKMKTCCAQTDAHNCCSTHKQSAAALCNTPAEPLTRARRAAASHTTAVSHLFKLAVGVGIR